MKNKTMDHINGKVIVITGASSGVGQATALLLAEKGAAVVLGARREDKLTRLATEIVRTGGKAIYAVTDVTCKQDVESLVTKALKAYGKLDAIVNNAGIAPLSMPDELNVDDWEKMIDVNIKGVMYGIAAALPVFRQQGYGHIINTASTSGIKISPSAPEYSGTKFAVRAISEGLRQEADANLRVTVITPGLVNTNLADTIIDKGVKMQIADMMTHIALSPDAIARAIAKAVDQTDNVDVNGVVFRPTAQA